MRRAMLVLAAAVAAWCAGAGCTRPAPEVRARLSVTQALGGETAGYARAIAPRTFEFPADHGPHDGFRTEWWYVTGHLDGEGGERFGFQLTFFRQALAPSMPARDSAWAARHVFMAHFALTDARGRRFRHAQRFAREAAGLAGAQGAPLRVFLEDWSLASEPGGATTACAFPLRLRASEGVGDAAFALDLVLDEGRPPVLQGDAGLSRKGPGEGNASYYYSQTRMPARGTVRSGPRTVAVNGTAWLDREWSTSALGPDLAGWDWFALQLGDGRDLMFYRLRRQDGSSDPFSKGSIAHPDGRVVPLSAPGVVLTPLSTWTSPRTGATYPSRWRLAASAPGEDPLDVELVPVLEDQELSDSVVAYWEGAMDVRGAQPGRAYVEMTGYTVTPRLWSPPP